MKLRCRLGLHTPQDSVADDCTYTARCTACGRVVRTGVVHAFTREGRVGADCWIDMECVRCGATEARQRHRNREVVAADLSPDELGGRTVGPCRVVLICDRCGLHDVQWEESHEYGGKPWNGCLRCGEVDDDGD